MAEGLVACPFCREMFAAGEHETCPECAVVLVATHKLPKTQAQLDAEEARTPPDEVVLPMTYLGRGRGPLIALAVMGLAAFFMPWVRETAPENQVLSGLDLARRLGWLWAPAVAWFVMVPLVVSRRNVASMRGARVAVAFLAGMALCCVIVRVVNAPASTALRTIRFSWGEGLWATGAIALAAVIVAVRFGGRSDVVPVPKMKRPVDETLH